MPMELGHFREAVMIQDPITSLVVVEVVAVGWPECLLNNGVSYNDKLTRQSWLFENNFPGVPDYSSNDPSEDIRIALGDMHHAARHGGEALDKLMKKQVKIEESYMRSAAFISEIHGTLSSLKSFPQEFFDLFGPCPPPNMKNRWEEPAPGYWGK